MNYNYTSSTVNVAILNKMLIDSSFSSKYLNTNSHDNDITVETSVVLTASEVLELDGLINNYSEPNVYTISSSVETALSKDQLFLAKLMRDFFKENVLVYGYNTSQGVQIRNDLGWKVFADVQSGFARGLRDTLQNMTPTTLLTQVRIDNFITKINTYLGE